MTMHIQDDNWHSLTQDEVLSRLDAGIAGLSGDEPQKRLAVYGPNRLTPPGKRSALARFASQFHNVLIYVLLGAVVVTSLLGHWIDAGVIAGVVVLNALVGFIQEGKAEQALDAIRSILSQQALVQRNGNRTLIQADELVPGDVVFLQSGDKVPADLRLVKLRDLRIDEAPLTGESLPVDKSTAVCAETATIGDRRCMAFSGTLVTYGQGTGIVTGTGDRTEIGRISGMLATVRPLATRLLQQIAEFGRQLTVAILGVAAATAVFGMFVQEYSAGDMFLAAVGLAVAAIPEGLPAIITITLAMGVRRMARRNALIRRLPAVETLGSVTVICSDKTGTLTRNEMTVKSIASASGQFDVTGVGYDPRGGFTLEDRDVSPSDHPLVLELARAALLCNDAALREQGGRWAVEGDPTEGALVTLAMKAGLNTALEQARFPRTDNIPFESEHRFMATLHHDHQGRGFVYVKGAPEKVLTMCKRQGLRGKEQAIDLRYWHERINDMAGRGERVIALAFKTAAHETNDLSFADVEDGLTLLGVMGIIDPPRDEAVQAVQRCRSAGIAVKMITGDHLLTARAIGSKMGIGDGQTAVSGEQIDGMSDEDLMVKVRKTDVFARVSPEHKLRLVQALQADGEVVAMTGDGVNDAPALKRADVGVAMGIKGTEVAKEAAEMVLTDDDFASIAHAVEEGRTIYDNIKKAITFILPTNGGEAGIVILAILSGRLLPITPVQILWVNMITAVTLALSLSFEPAEAGVMARAPRNPKDPILSYFLIWRTLLVSLILVIGTFGLFLWERMHGAPLEMARTVAVNTLVMFEIFYLLNTRYLTKSVLSQAGLFGNRYIYIAIATVIIFQLLFTYAPFMALLFDSRPIGIGDWVKIVAVGASVFVVVEIEKLCVERYARNEK